MRGGRAALAASALLAALGGQASGAEVVVSAEARATEEAAASMFMDVLMATPQLDGIRAVAVLGSAASREQASDTYLRAYLVMQQGEEQMKAGDTLEGVASLAQARMWFEVVRTLHPAWNEPMVVFRIRKVDQAIFKAWLEHPDEVRRPEANEAPELARNPEEIEFEHDAFTFVRVKYTSDSGRARHWATDYPDADRNFAAHFETVTGVPSVDDGLVLELTDPRLGGHPFLYLAEGGHLRLQPGEADALRDYLLGGGFLMVDDFWGREEWAALEKEFRAVFPDRPAVELSMDHPIFRSFYRIRRPPQVPSLAVAMANRTTGITWERSGAERACYRGISDDDGRLMVVFCHNTDLGDGWERGGESDYYDREFSQKRAFPMGVNIVTYALTDADGE